MKSDMIEISLQAILDKLNIPPRKEDVMQSELDFGKLELEEDLRGSQRKTDEGSASVLGKVKPATLVDFDGEQEKGCAFFNTYCIYFTVIRDLFPNDQSHIHWVLSFFKSD